LFFITSGFLVTGSYLSKNNIWSFTRARIFRIYPALIASVLFSVFIVGLWFTTLSAGDFISDPITHKFIYRNSFLFDGIKYYLPGVFLDNPLKGAVNGSLWTLPYEVKMYSYLALLMLLTSYIKTKGKLNISLKTISICLTILFGALNLYNHFYVDSRDYFIHLGLMFSSGATYFIWKDSIRLSLKALFACSIALVLSSYHSDIFFISYCLLLPFIILIIAYIPGGSIRGFNKLGDYSYGMYIYAFPIQQSLAASIQDIAIATMIAGSFSITLVLAIVSWHFLEKPFLNLNKRLNG
jgi:peptidoglycan/LPS O-acetylase OafA/YrhL